MPKALMTLALLFGSLVAQASPDVRFTYTNAQSAYSSASHAPTLTEVTAAPWILVGMATAQNQNHTQNGYWPDGKYPESGAGTYQSYLTISQSADAFGNPLSTATETLFGGESGTLYSTGLDTYSLDAAGIHLSSAQPDPANCAQETTCRIVTATGMLLCKVEIVDTTRGCKEGLPSGTAYTFQGYLPVQQ
jgi:hypothetical protein